MLSGTHLPGRAQRTYLTLNVARALAPVARTENRDPATGLLDAEGFAGLAVAAQQAAEGTAVPYGMTLVEIGGLDALTGRLAAAEAEAFVTGISTYLQSYAVRGEAVGRLTSERFGLIQEEVGDVAAIERTLVERSRAIDPAREGVSVAANSVSLRREPGLSTDQSAKALLYVVNRFAHQRSNFSFGDLSNGLRAFHAEVMTRLDVYKRIVSANAFDVLYQPIVDLKTRAVHHFEALVRPQDTSTFPDTADFIGFAERMDVIADFDLTMVGRIVAKILEGRAQKDLPRVAVNVSGRSLSDASFIARLLELLRSYRNLAESLSFEVTESSQITDLECANAVIQELRRESYKVIFDDFGAGAAAFQYLRAFEVDFVKIDGLYVREALGNAKATAFLGAMAGLCRALVIDTVAEMVEREEEVRLLLEAGVRYGQGYLLGRPGVGLTGIRTAAASSR